MIFKFYDTDVLCEADYDIDGGDYRTLLEVCFRYCTTVSMRVTDESVVVPAKLEQFRISAMQSAIKVYHHYYPEKGNKQAFDEIHQYHLTPEVKDYILKVTDSIFKWICNWEYKNPEDIAFFRKDGSPFFVSIVHDGVCTLEPRENEDVSNIVSKNWMLIDETDLAATSYARAYKMAMPINKFSAK